MPFWRQKVVLVTGGSSGLGLAIARAFSRAGAQIIISSRDEDRLRSAAESLSTAASACSWLTADVTRQDQVENLVEQARQIHGRLDVLVNCAGRSTRGEVAGTSAEQFAEFLDVNFLSAVRCTRAALPHLLERGGHVVNIGSLAAKTASPYLGAYPASKFPLAAYSQQLRLELGHAGLHVLLVCPGPIRRTDAGQRYDEHAAKLPQEALQPGGGVRMGGLDPDWLARRVVRACERRKAELIIPSYTRLLFAIQAFSPRLGDWLINRWIR